MVLVLLLTLFLALVSVVLWAHTRSVLTSAAADAARQAANADAADRSPTDRVHDQLTGGLSGSTIETLSCSSEIEGLMAAVTCSLDAPGIIGLLDGVLPTITVTGHAARENAG